MGVLTLTQIQNRQIEQIRRDSIKPSVSIQLLPGRNEINMFEIQVKNHGVGTAQNISFTISNANSEAEDAFNFISTKLNELMFIGEGIMSLSSGDVRESFLLSGYDFFKKFDNSFSCKVRVTIRYEDMESRKYKNTQYFNFKEFEGISNIGGHNQLYELSKHLKKIEAGITKVASGQIDFKVNSYSQEDRNRASAERFYRWKAPEYELSQPNEIHHEKPISSKGQN